MKMKTKLLIPIWVLFFACQTGQGVMTENQKETLQKEAVQVIENVFEVLAAGSGETRMELCENSDEFSFTLPEGVFTFNGLKDYVTRDLKSAVKESLETQSEKYILIDPSCFTYVWHGKMNIHLNTGEILTCDDYYSTWTFRKRDGNWKMVNGHESSKEPFYVENSVKEE